ncbi:MAG TPA: NAD(P)H-dependent oxidoreductase [Symbiobacteriaceae bacterium]|nr:NAD(P)H-dependent oxidoreductase [Symbiobacteriaceae bacterium]
MVGKRLLLLNGSPRKKGTSATFARTIGLLALDQGCIVENEHVIDFFDHRRSLQDLREQLADADVIGLCMPLYYDTVPGIVVWLFEQIWQGMPGVLKGKTIFAVSQSAYPFTRLNEPALEVCRCFAEAVGARWAGGLGYGGGVLINGAHLDEYGQKGQKLIEAFDLALTDVLAGRIIAKEPQALMETKIPRFVLPLFALGLNWMIRRDAKRHGVSPDLGGQVYLHS